MRKERREAENISSKALWERREAEDQSGFLRIDVEELSQRVATLEQKVTSLTKNLEEERSRNTSASNDHELIMEKNEADHKNGTFEGKRLQIRTQLNLTQSY